MSPRTSPSYRELHIKSGAKPFRPQPLASPRERVTSLSIANTLGRAPPTLAERAQERGILKGERIAKNSACTLKFNQQAHALNFAAPLSLERRSFGYFPSLLKESDVLPPSVSFAVEEK